MITDQMVEDGAKEFAKQRGYFWAELGPELQQISRDCARAVLEAALAGPLAATPKRARAKRGSVSIPRPTEVTSTFEGDRLVLVFRTDEDLLSALRALNHDAG